MPAIFDAHGGKKRLLAIAIAGLLVGTGTQLALAQQEEPTEPPQGTQDPGGPFPLPTGVGEELILVVATAVPSVDAATTASEQFQFHEFSSFYIDAASNYDVLGTYEQVSPDEVTVPCRQNVLGMVGAGIGCEDGEVAAIFPLSVDLQYIAGADGSLWSRDSFLLLTAFRTKTGAEEFLAYARDMESFKPLATVRATKLGGGYVGLGQEAHPNGSGPLYDALPNPSDFQIRSDSYEIAILETPGLVGYWRLGEDLPLGAVNAALPQNSGIYRGAVTTGEAGVITGDSAVRFAGGRMNPQPLYEDPIEAFTWEFWINRQEPTIGIDVLGSLDLHIRMTPDGFLQVEVEDDWGCLLREDRGTAQLTSTSAVSFYEWTHVAFMANPDWFAEGRSGMELYVNGALAQSSSFVERGGDCTFPREIVVGEGSDGMGHVLDEIAVYERALTPAEIGEHIQSVP